VGDRILVGGKLSDDNLSLSASTIVVMKSSDLAARHEQERQDWQKRGVDGLVKSVDPAAGTVTITVRNKPLVIQSSSSTVIRRYSPDSVKFDDAKPSKLAEIHPGDQVRARGDRGADGTQLTAEEVVSGSFRNIAGTVDSVDASSSTLSVHDLLSNKNALIKITADSQLRQLPPEMAQRIAMRLKGAATVARPALPPAPRPRQPARMGPQRDLPGAWPMEEMAQAGVQAVLRIFSKCSVVFLQLRCLTSTKAMRWSLSRLRAPVGRNSYHSAERSRAHLSGCARRQQLLDTDALEPGRTCC